MPVVTAVLHTDPGCPWAYSAIPALRVMQWRYGDGLDWRLVMIGLAEDRGRYEARGYTPAGMAAGQAEFRDRFGMPFALVVKDRVQATARACRAVVAARLRAPGEEWQALRALQLANFTTGLLLDDDAGLAAALSAAGLDGEEIVARLDAPEVTEAYERDRAEARTAAGSPTEAQGKAAATDGPVRYTAPSLVLERDGRRLEAGGWQTVEVYDALVANLDPRMARRPPADDPEPLLRAFPEGLVTQEAAMLMTHGNDAPDRAGAEQALFGLVARGRAVRTPLGGDALWRAA